MTQPVSQSRDRVADELEIRKVVHRYADAASRRDAAAVATTFIADGQWQSPELGNYQGHDALVPFFTSMLQDWNAFIQGLLSGLVVFDATDSDRARAAGSSRRPVNDPTAPTSASPVSTTTNICGMRVSGASATAVTTRYSFARTTPSPPCRFRLTRPILTRTSPLTPPRPSQALIYCVSICFMKA
jgi:hypothetical protein